MFQEIFHNEFYYYCEKQSSNYFILFFYFIILLTNGIFYKEIIFNYFQLIIQTIIYILIIFHSLLILKNKNFNYLSFISSFNLLFSSSSSSSSSSYLSSTISSISNFPSSPSTNSSLRSNLNSSSRSNSSSSSSLNSNNLKLYILRIFQTEYLTSLIIIFLSISLIDKLILSNNFNNISIIESSKLSTVLTIKDNINYNNQYIENQLLIQIIYTILVPFILKCHHIGSIFISITILLSSLLYSYLFLNFNIRIFYNICFCLLLELVVLFDQEISLRKGFYSYQESQKSKTSLQNELTIQQSKYNEIKSLFGNVSHDLKSPLQAFILELDALYEIINNSSIHSISLKQSIDSILLLKSICDFMLILVNRAMDFTKSASGIVLTPSHQTVDIILIMKWVEQFARRSLYPIPIYISPLPSNICSHVITDQQWLKENLLCLVSNAQKFSTDGVITIKSSLVVESNSNEKVKYVKVEVEDEGIGISDDKIEVLFQPFKQAQLMAGGTGLGLFSLSKRIECLGGTYGVKKRLDGKTGSCFWFTIPYRPDYEASISSHQNSSSSFSSFSSTSSSLSPSLSLSPNQLSPKNMNNNNNNKDNNNKNNNKDNKDNYNKSIDNKNEILNNLINENIDDFNNSNHTDNESNITEENSIEFNKNLKILLVEDSILIQKTTKRTLSREGYNVDVANNGLECMKLIELNNKYDVILMDLHMPLMDGLEATKRLRIYEKDLSFHLKHLIIGLSANSDEDSSNKAILAGMNDFIAKPLNANELKRCLKRHWYNQKECLNS